MTLPAVPTDLEDELKAERAHLAESREALRRMRERAEALFAIGADVSGDPFGAESLGRALARRIAELSDDPSAPLFFGRLDMHVRGSSFTSAAATSSTIEASLSCSTGVRRCRARSTGPACATRRSVAIRRRFGWQFASTA